MYILHYKFLFVLIFFIKQLNSFITKLNNCSLNLTSVVLINLSKLNNPPKSYEYYTSTLYVHLYNMKWLHLHY